MRLSSSVPWRSARTSRVRRRWPDFTISRDKWLIASVEEDAAAVVSRVFDEAERRDPKRDRTWVALVDGNNHQIDRIRAEARAGGWT